MKHFYPKIERRNSTIEFLDNDGRKFVRKSYKQVYHVSDERAAYDSLGCALRGNMSVKLPAVYDIDEKQNSISIEYVEGVTFDRFLTAGNSDEIATVCSILLDVAILLQEEHLAFDLDPSNIIVLPEAQKICIIDPIAQAFFTEHFCCVVLLIGFIKCAASCRRWSNAKLLWRGFQSIYFGYSKYNDLRQHELDKFIVKYIGKVIQWNLQGPSEGGGMPWIRRKLMFPLGWTLVQLMFRVRLYFGRSDGWSSSD